MWGQGVVGGKAVSGGEELRIPSLAGLHVQRQSHLLNHVGVARKHETPRLCEMVRVVQVVEGVEVVQDVPLVSGGSSGLDG